MDAKCWAHFLHNRIISGFAPGQFPSTPFNRDMKIFEFESHIMWIHHWLQGRSPLSPATTSTTTTATTTNVPLGIANRDDGPCQLPAEDIYEMYKAWYNQNKDSMKYKVLHEMTQFLQKFKEVLNLTDSKQQGSRANRKRVYNIPSFQECRNLFQNHLKEPDWEWDD